MCFFKKEIIFACVSCVPCLARWPPPSSHGPRWSCSWFEIFCRKKLNFQKKIFFFELLLRVLVSVVRFERWTSSSLQFFRLHNSYFYGTLKKIILLYRLPTYKSTKYKFNFSNPVLASSFPTSKCIMDFLAEARAERDDKNTNMKANIFFVHQLEVFYWEKVFPILERPNKYIFNLQNYFYRLHTRGRKVIEVIFKKEIRPSSAGYCKDENVRLTQIALQYDL